MVDRDGLILQKDLGKETDKVAAAMTEYNPDESWRVVQE
jgi:hypothetical protein